MFLYDVYSHEGERGFEIELMNRPGVLCQFSFYDIQLNEEIESSYSTDSFVSPDDVDVIDGIIHIQGNPIYN